MAAQTFVIQVRTGGVTGPVIATSPTITLNDTSTVSSPYTLTTSASEINEGSEVTISVYTVGLPNGTLLPYTISGSGIDLDDFVGLTSLSGSFRITNNFGSVRLVLKNDLKTELDETLTLTLTSTGNNESINVIIRDTSKTTSLANFFVSSPVSVVEEGQVARFDIRATNLEPGTVVPYRILGISQEDLTGDSQTVGYVTFVSGAVEGETYANVSLSIYEDFITEGPESIVLLLEPSFPYTLQLSSTISIKDTTLNPGPTYSITANKNRVFENDTIVFTLVATNVPAGGIVPWQIAEFEPDTPEITVSDFSGITSLTGNFPPLVEISTGVFSSNITLSIRDDLVFEQSEYFYVFIPGTRIGSQVVEIIDSGNTLITSDATFSGNILVNFLDPAVLRANLGSLASGVSYWQDTTGLISENMVIQGKTPYATEDSLALYQPFSYVIRSKVSIEEWRDSIKALLHPAGMVIFGEINNETTTENLLSLEVKAVSDSTIRTQDSLTIDDTEVNASTTSIGGSNVTVDSLTFSFNL